MAFCCGNLLLLFCCGNFCVPVRESFYKKLPVCRCKRLGIAALGYAKVGHWQLKCFASFVLKQII